MSPRIRRVLVWTVLAWALVVAPAPAGVVGARVTVTTSPTLISRSGSELGPVLIKNTGAAAVYLGGATVATTTGYELAAAETISLMLAADEALYGIVASGTVVLHKLENRK